MHTDSHLRGYWLQLYYRKLDEGSSSVLGAVADSRRRARGAEALDQLLQSALLSVFARARVAHVGAVVLVCEAVAVKEALLRRVRTSERMSASALERSVDDFRLRRFRKGHILLWTQKRRPVRTVCICICIPNHSLHLRSEWQLLRDIRCSTLIRCDDYAFQCHHTLRYVCVCIQ